MLIVHVTGDLDLATAPRVEEELTPAPTATRVVVDLETCTFLDSSGVRVLSSTARALEEAGGRLDLVVAEGSGIARVLEISGMQTLFRIHSSLDAAL